MPKHLTTDDAPDFVPADSVGVANGIAPLGEDSKVPSTFLPDLASAAVRSVNGMTGWVVLGPADVGAVAANTVGNPNGVAPLDATGRIPVNKLPLSAVQTVNGYAGPAVTLAASDVGALALSGGNLTGTLSVRNTTATAMGYISVRDYGAVGDNSTDDTAAIQAAINACPQDGVVYFPPGRYRTTSPLLLPPGVNLVGYQAQRRPRNNWMGFSSVSDASYISPRSTFTGAAVILVKDAQSGGWSTMAQNSSISHLRLNCSALPAGGNVDGIQVFGQVQGLILDNVSVAGPSGYCFNFATNPAVTAGPNNPFSLRVLNCFATGGGTATTQGGFFVYNCTDSTFIDCETIAVGGDGWIIQGGGNSHFIGCRSENNPTNGFTLTKTSGGTNCTAHLLSCSTNGNAGHGFNITFAQTVALSSCIAHGEGSTSSGFNLNSTTGVVTLTNCMSVLGSTSQYGISVTGNLTASIHGGMYYGTTAGYHDGGSNTNVYKSPNVIEATGSTSTPTVSVNGVNSGIGGLGIGQTAGGGNTFRMTSGTSPMASLTGTANGQQIMSVTGADSASVAYQATVTGDTVNRFRIDAGGGHSWGPGGGSSRDVNWKRQGVGIIGTDNTLQATNGLQLGSTTTDFGGGVGVVGIKNAATVPATNPTNGAIVYTEGGVLKARQPDGTVVVVQNPPVTSVAGKTGAVTLTASDVGALTQSTADGRYPQKSAQVINVKDYGAQGDGTTDDWSAIMAAINAIPASGGGLYFPRGAYVISQPIVPKSYTRLFSDAWGRAKIISTSSDLFQMDGSQIDRLEIDHLALDVTNGHAFTGANVLRSHFHHLDINVRSADKAVWNAPAVVLMIECYFSEIQYHVYGATRSIPAWNLVSSGIDLVTECVWERMVCWNNDNDATQYQFLVSCTNANGANRNNTWRNVVFEQACGGAIKIDSCTGSLIEGCYSWDTPANSIQNALFAITKNPANSTVPRNTVIRSSGRVGDGLASGIYDISLSSTSLQTTLDNVQGSTTTPIRMNLGGAVGVWLNNVQASATIDGVTSANYSYLQRGALTAQPISTADAYTALMLDTTGARGALRGQGQNASQRLITGLVAGDAQARVIDFLDGKRTYGDGTNAADTTLRRSGAGVLSTDNNFSALTGLQVGAITPDLGGGVGVLGLKNASTVPTSNPTNGAILYSEGGVMKVRQADGTIAVLKSESAYTAADHGLIAWTMDPGTTSTTGTPLSAGFIYMLQVILRQPASISKVNVVLGAAGATLTANQCLAGLYDTSGNRLAITADMSTTWNSAGNKTMSFTSSYTAAAGKYYIALLFNGTTSPTFACGSTLGASFTPGNANLSAGSYRWCRSAAGQTTLPTSVTLSGYTPDANNIYAAVG